MKLNQLASSDSTTMELKHPITGAPLGAFITAFTPDSSQWMKAEKAQAVPNAKQSLILAKNKNEGHRIELPSDAAEKRQALIVQMITDVTGIDDFTFSPKAVKELFDDPLYQWMYTQLDEHLSDRANFFGKSEKTSRSTSKASDG